MNTPSRTVLITGCSSGIGRATARLLAAKGFYVLAGVRSAADAADLADETLRNLEPVLLDVTSDEAVTRVVEQIEATSPQGLYALVNNAGLGLPAAVELTQLDELRKLLEVNTIAPLRLIQNLLPLLRKGSGRIVNVSSLNGTFAAPMVGAYSASKFALEALSDSLRVELRPWKIPVSLICPGQVRTSIFDKAESALAEGERAIPAELRDGYGVMYARAAKYSQRGMKSRTSPDKVAAVILRALTATYPRARYRVGLDARGVRLLKACIPQRMLDRLLARTIGTFKPLDQRKKRSGD